MTPTSGPTPIRYQTPTIHQLKFINPCCDFINWYRSRRRLLRKTFEFGTSSNLVGTRCRTSYTVTWHPDDSGPLHGPLSFVLLKPLRMEGVGREEKEGRE